MSKISRQLLISGQFQDICHISGISGQLGALSFVGEFYDDDFTVTSFKNIKYCVGASEILQ